MAFFITGEIILLTEMLGKRSKLANLMFVNLSHAFRVFFQHPMSVLLAVASQ